MVATINADASHIWDEAEVWIQSKTKVDAAGGIANVMPAFSDGDFSAKGWDYVGLIDAGKGIPVEPEGELKEFDGFGFAAYRSKFSKGKLKTGFTCLEENAVTSGIVLPGSTADKIGVPRDLQYYVLYRTVDAGYADLGRVSLRPALLELTGHSGAVEGEQESYEFKVHHAPDTNKDVFQKLSAAPAPSAWTVTLTGVDPGDSLTLTVTVGGVAQTTAGVAGNASSATVKSALEALANVSSATVSGSAGGPYAVTLAGGGILSGVVSGAGSVAVAPA